jgi:mannose/fructose-specific phosphotransferase system component IIA
VNHLIKVTAGIGTRGERMVDAMRMASLEPTGARHTVISDERPPAPAVRDLVTGALGGLVRTVESILGAQSDVETLSNAAYSIDGLIAAVEERVHSIPAERSIVLFTDLAAGSCGIASRRALFPEQDVRRISGINLPMLLEFFHYRDTLPLDELLPRLESKGRAGIAVL